MKQFSFSVIHPKNDSLFRLWVDKRLKRAARLPILTYSRTLRFLTTLFNANASLDLSHSKCSTYATFFLKTKLNRKMSKAFIGQSFWAFLTLAAVRFLSRSKIGLRYFPVYDFFTLATCSGVPVAITCPPPSPPSGPRSIK